MKWSHRGALQLSVGSPSTPKVFHPVCILVCSYSLACRMVTCDTEARGSNQIPIAQALHGTRHWWILGSKQSVASRISLILEHAKLTIHRHWRCSYVPKYLLSEPVPKCELYACSSSHNTKVLSSSCGTNHGYFSGYMTLPFCYQNLWVVVE